MVGFIFGGEGMPKTPQELEQMRDLARSKVRSRTPQNVGEGIASIGDAILYRAMMNRADKGEREGIANADSAFSSLFSTPDAAATDASATVPPVDAVTAPTITSPQDAIDASPQKPLTGDLAQTESYIRQAAQQRGVNPDIAVKVARSEGLAPGVWQSRVKKGDQYEPSYGAFQMLLGDGKTFPKGMGNDFMERTGLDPRDPKNHNAMIDFALDTAKKDGWRQWYGAKNVGINRWDGINADQVASADSTVPVNAMLPKQEQVPVVPVPDGFEQPDPLAAEQPVQVADNSAVMPRKRVADAMMQNPAFDMQKAVSVMNDPFLSKGKRSIAEFYVKQHLDQQNAEIEAQRKQADPAYKIGLEKSQIELDRLKNPPKARRMTDAEETDAGLPVDGVYQILPDGTYKTVREPAKPGDALANQKTQIEIDNLTNPKQAKTLTADEAKALGLDPTGVYQTDVGGKISTIKTPTDPNADLDRTKKRLEVLNLVAPPKARTLSEDEEKAAGLDPSGVYQEKPDGTITAVKEPTALKPTGTMQEYEAYKADAIASGEKPLNRLQYEQALRSSSASQVNINQKTEGAFDQELAKKQAATFDTMATEGLNARADLDIVNQLGEFMKGQGGMGTGLASYASSWGIKVPDGDDLTAAKALINKLVPTQRQPGSGTMSDRDVELFKDSLPSLWNQPGGNEKILGIMRGLAEYKQNQGEIADQVIMGEMTRQEARRALREIPNPLAEFRKQQKAKKAKIDGYTIEEVE